MHSLLSLNHVTKRYGSLVVTNNFSLKLERGDVLGIIGPNGAGKTTLFNLISGDVACDAGRIYFKGADITREAPHKRCRKGIGRTYQIARPFEGITVYENLLVGAMFAGPSESQSERTERCAGILEQTKLLSKANALAGALTLLDRKRLELARALSSSPELILLDELQSNTIRANAP